VGETPAALRIGKQAAIVRSPVAEGLLHRL
jgi:hypothetical protein